MKRRWMLMAAFTTVSVMLAACGSGNNGSTAKSSNAAGAADTETAVESGNAADAGQAADTDAAAGAEQEADADSSVNAEGVQELIGKGTGFGGEIVAHVTVEDGVITAVVFEGEHETVGIGAAALEELAAQVVEANGVEIDGVSGATMTMVGCRAAILNALDPEVSPYEGAGTDQTADSAAEGAAALEAMTFPEDKKIVSATTYGIYTKKEDSPQDAVMKTTLYWNETDEKVYDIRFLQAMLPWDDNGAAGGWANVTDEVVLEKLGDAVISFTADVYGNQVKCNYAKYIQIGDIVWTGKLGSAPACEQAVVYSADLGMERLEAAGLDAAELEAGKEDGAPTLLTDYVATEAGGAWYHEAALEDAYLLILADAAATAADEQVAGTVKITYKETNGHGEGHWNSDLKFSGNMEAIKEFVMENGFTYEYYADGGFSQNADGYWETVDAVSGATLDEAPSYFDTLKRLYEKILVGESVKEN